MITTITPYTDPRNRALPGEGFDGVVRVVVGAHYGTGTLLFGGHAILTAAHLFTDNATSAEVHFETAQGAQTITSSQVTTHGGHDADGNNDLAIIWLSESAPLLAERYSLYRDSNEIDQTITMVGYGKQGTGATGKVDSTTALRSKASNQVDGLIGTLKEFQGNNMSWNPTSDSQLIADFDDGTSPHDALGLLMDKPGLGLGQSEGLIAPGDSGGPAFINGQIAGVASYTTHLTSDGTTPDIDNISNSSFGEVAAWQRVSYYQQWIDESLRAALPSAPAQAANVVKAVAEGNSGTSYAYFLVKFNNTRPNDTETFSVSYATRNGTATAGSDYIAAGGTLNIYPDESQVVIPVEIIGDTTPEPNETFYMDITNPTGGGFGHGIVTLTAVRTILNDDGPILS
ncbi:MAG: hypothetical protein RIR18_1442 [Pseudomonadota bacterium]|jgi:hypothetical protein